ncbi:hypothetical protein AB5J03_003112 [Yersinia enterocolitica]|nr:hypothetical protein [Yersinia enterocolitica]EKN3994434.1 hypothetical protein [Yersinia enterocolitica]EKN5083407.1 hypothetical protein [Yersinia enterocolitica]EKN6400317.1 hypothetical protein [Yersinia enterocolitica]EKP3833006.1 hypothetical protein [Yersinia enterocolitica]
MIVSFEELKARKKRHQEFHYVHGALIRLGLLPRDPVRRPANDLPANPRHRKVTFVWDLTGRQNASECSEVEMLEDLYLRTQVFCQSGHISEDVLKMLKEKIDALTRS